MKAIGDYIKTLTKEQLEESLKAGEQKAQEALDRYNNKIPPKARKGVCVVCKNEVTETFTKEFHQPMRYGDTDKGFWKSSGLSCTNCGIAYAWMPGMKRNGKRK